jgi:cell division septation protein DedD
VSAVTPSQGADLTGNLGMVQEGAAAAASLALPSPVVATIAPDPLPAPPSAGTVAAKRTHEKQKAKLAPERKSDKGVQSNNTSKTAKLTKAERRAMLKADKAAKAATKAAEKSLADNGAETNSAQYSRKFLINIGLFADDNNARNAIVKLQDVGFPVLSQEVKSSKGVRTRVRVGPFETQPEAERAAERIRGLQLDAAVFKQ